MKLSPSRFAVILLLAIGVPLASSAAQWRAKAPVEKKATRLSASQETLLELLTQLESLQAEVQTLRNQTEVQQNEINRLRSRLQDVTRDLDRRISSIERRTGAGGKPAVASGGGKEPVKPAVTVNGEEQKLYDGAFQLMKQGDYTSAARESLPVKPAGIQCTVLDRRVQLFCAQLSAGAR